LPRDAPLVHCRLWNGPARVRTGAKKESSDVR
jgi:hypothetical protein